MRLLVVAAAFALAACNPNDPAPPPAPEPDELQATPPWFICDAIDAPVLLVFERANGVARVAQYEKPSGAIVARTEYTIGESEGAAGSVFTPLLQNGEDAGVIREVNAGMLETPGSAFTTPYRSVRLGEREISCRWLPRTRVFGFTGRRSFAVHEDPDGDLIYTTYDFATAADAQQIDLTENGRTTTFSVEVRDGEEATGPDGVAYVFDNEGFRYNVTLRPNQSGTLTVMRGEETLQEEPLVAFQQATGPE